MKPLSDLPSLFCSTPRQESARRERQPERSDKEDACWNELHRQREPPLELAIRSEVTGICDEAGEGVREADQHAMKSDPDVDQQSAAPLDLITWTYIKPLLSAGDSSD